ncbi:hypothetical protein Tco_0453446 [Tanacetum coccineum]
MNRRCSSCQPFNGCKGLVPLKEVKDLLLMVEDHHTRVEIERWWSKNKSSNGNQVVERLLEKLVELSMCSPMVERMVDREEKKFLD